MKSKDISKILNDINSEVYISIGDDCYPAKVRVFIENGKKTPYIVIDNTQIHKNFPEKYGCEEITKT